MKTPSTKDTIGCATEVKQPSIPKWREMMIERQKKLSYIQGRRHK